MNRELYDVVVIGAGPAGAMAALRCARSGASVLLVDKHRFPRHKVCGCCLNGAAIAALKRAGLGDLPQRLGGAPLSTLRLACGRYRADLPLAGAVAISRAAMDGAIVESAITAGVKFIDGQAAQVGAADSEGRSVHFGRHSVIGRCVVVASGLGSSSGHSRPEGGRIGLCSLLTDGTGYPRGQVHMACAARGYVGLVRLEDGRLDIAAAVDPRFVRRCGGAGQAVRQILDSCHMAAPLDLSAARWRGTPLLTRQPRHVARERLLMIGDAAGYVEPFTGEGIAWALSSGWSGGELACKAWEPAMVAEWSRRIALLRRRQGACRWIARLLRRPRLTRCAVAALSLAPRVARPMFRHLDRPISMDSAAARA